jgi:hypothetical protein
MIPIDPFWFFLSLAIGLFAVYIMAPAPHVVVKFPSPQNAGKITYKDKADTCYVYKADPSTCPSDALLIKPQPLNI